MQPYPLSVLLFLSSLLSTGTCSSSLNSPRSPLKQQDILGFQEDAIYRSLTIVKGEYRLLAAHASNSQEEEDDSESMSISPSTENETPRPRKPSSLMTGVIVMYSLVLTCIFIFLVWVLFKCVKSFRLRGRRIANFSVKMKCMSASSVSREIARAHECIICLEKIQEDIVVTRCEHRFHKKCLKRWVLLKESCPTCRTEF